MSIQPAVQGTFSFLAELPIVIETTRAQLTSDAGLLPIHEFEERIGLTRSFAAVLDDPRDPQLLAHPFLPMTRSRVYGIRAGYEDQNDHDTLRADPVFKLVADRSPEDDDLASQPTLSRFENAISLKSLKRLRDVFLDQFIASFDTPPRHLTFDLDAAAMNLLVRLRRFIAEPLPALPTQAETTPAPGQSGEAAGPADETCVPVEALAGAERQLPFRLRQQRDPLGEGHPCTWRTLLIKVAAEVAVRTRRIVVRLSSSWPHLEWYLRGCERLRNPLPTPVADPSG